MTPEEQVQHTRSEAQKLIKQYDLKIKYEFTKELGKKIQNLSAK